ncbi:DUF2513 domain-containing protein [Clostridium botulinum]|nr:DUF2513 domain-containing protein [Clostridium botulinum]NFP29661.1 DUF2513 domain-containing protein [Clostridium botulinum]
MLKGGVFMRLNPDCVRDVLLAVENNDFGLTLSLNDLHSKIPTCSKDEIHYACLKLSEGGYLNISTLPIAMQDVLGISSIEDLTFQGHEFLADIKADTNWNKTKDVAKKVGSFSLNTLKDIAAQVIAEVIKKSF